jgi:hypothetical protein
LKEFKKEEEGGPRGMSLWYNHHSKAEYKLKLMEVLDHLITASDLNETSGMRI